MSLNTKKEYVKNLCDEEGWGDDHVKNEIKETPIGVEQPLTQRKPPDEGDEKNDDAPTEYEIVDYQSFDQMGLKEEILKNIYKNGFEKPSVIQKKAIKPFVDGYDCLGIANSGFGKSLIECCGILNQIDASINKTWARASRFHREKRLPSPSRP